MTDRISALKASFSSLKADGILICDKVSHRYFTGIDNEDGFLLFTKENNYAFEDSRYTEIAKKTLDGVYEVIDPKNGIFASLDEVFKSERCSSVGFENTRVSYDFYQKLSKKFEKISFVGIGETVSALREVKSEDEVRAIKKAQEITDLTFSHILDVVSPSMTECDVALELEYFMRKNGAQDKSFDTIAISGTHTSMPHGVPSREKLQRGFLTLDFGAVVDGYHSDMTRTVCLGKATKEMKDVYQTVLNAQKSALATLKSGLICSEVDKVARDIIHQNYRGTFGHSLGHGVGLEIHEEPRLSPKCDKVLKKGNIVTVEPGIYLPSKFGVRIEDMGLICENSLENFTKSEKNLIEI